MKKILPPTLLIVSIGLMILLHIVIPVLRILQFPFNLFGLVFAFTGVLISILGSNQFARRKTTVMTFDIPDELVTDGLYQYSRNPMYLGFVLLMIGVWILLGSLSPVIVVISYLIILERYYIHFEELVMERKFGVLYLEYKKHVRKWI